MRTIIAFDDHINNRCKKVFQDCSDNARQISANKNIEHILIDSSRLNKDEVKSVVQEQGNEDFLFAAFSHGNDNILACTDANEPYLSNKINTSIFKDKIVYTYACNAGRILGAALISEGAKAFIGYTEEVWMSLLNSNAFAECATYGIEAILDGKSLSDCIEDMKGKYTNEYDKALEGGDLLGAGYLLDSRDALVLISR